MCVLYNTNLIDLASCFAANLLAVRLSRDCRKVCDERVRIIRRHGATGPSLAFSFLTLFPITEERPMRRKLQVPLICIIWADWHHSDVADLSFSALHTQHIVPELQRRPTLTRRQ